MAVTKAINSNVKSFAVIGTFEGECADSNITNLNGLDITRDVWETVFTSDDFKKAIDLGWYIGFLGHPEDPNCMDFEHACIVMTECHIDDNGKVYGKFNLIDTPVGRIVKAFIDAGVTFGISVRGAGDIIDNSVDADSFVFRGFDLVTFPAFPESIPTFSEIAASTSIEDQQKYKKICAAVEQNVEGLNTESAINMIQTCFAKQSTPYKALEQRKSELSKVSATEVNDIVGKKIASLTDLYLSGAQQNAELNAELGRLRKDIKCSEIRNTRKLKAVERIMAAQVDDLNKQLDQQTKKYSQLTKIHASTKQELKSLEKINLKYKCKIETSVKDKQHQEAVFANLQSRADETVKSNKDLQTRVSNLEAENKSLNDEVNSLNDIIASYQSAYAGLYATVVGVNLDHIDVSAHTSVAELKRIVGGTESVNKTRITSAVETPAPVDFTDTDDLITV